MALQVGRWQHSTRGLATPSGQYDAVVIGGGTSARVQRTRIRVPIGFSAGPGGYVAAIKAAQLGLKVCPALSFLDWLMASSLLDRVYREAWYPRWDVLERRVYPFQSHVEQLAHLPPNAP